MYLKIWIIYSIYESIIKVSKCVNGLETSHVHRLWICPRPYPNPKLEQEKIVITYLLRCIEVSKLSFELSMMLFTWVRRIVWMVIVTGRWSCVQLITNTCICMNLETWWMLSSIWSSTWRESEKHDIKVSLVPVLERTWIVSDRV